MNPTIKSTLKNTITTLESKSREVVAADFSVKTASDRAAAAQKKIGTEEAKVASHETRLDDVNSQLESPKEDKKSCGCKNNDSSKDVDTKEMAKLQKEKKDITALITQARSEVESAKEEAETASTDALKAAGVKQETIQEANELQSRISTIQITLNEGGKVSDDDLNKLATDINKLAGKFTKDDNKADALGNAIYDPLARGLKNIIKVIEKNSAQPKTSTPPQDGTINKKLFDIGIKGEPQTKIAGLIEKIASNNTQMNNGKTFTKEEVRALHTEYKSLTTGLTDTQKNSDVIKGFKTDMEGFVNRSGHSDILTASGS
jgi:hypothetical protein